MYEARQQAPLSLSGTADVLHDFGESGHHAPRLVGSGAPMRYKHGSLVLERNTQILQGLLARWPDPESAIAIPPACTSS